jgi:hypothetical protein
MANEKFKVKFGLAVGDTQVTIDGTTGNIVTAGDLDVKGGDIQNSTGGLTITSTGANTIALDPGSGTTTNDGHMVLGQLNTNAILTTNGTGSLDLRTGTYPTTANINLASGVNGNITVDTDGTGQVVINADVDVNGTIYLDQLQVDNININGNTISSTDTNGSITLDPNGTGDVAVTFADGGNLTNNRNYVFGAIRNATTESIGDIWALNSTGPSAPFRGVSIDNSADTTKGPGTVLRSYTGSSSANNATRSRIIFEKARGTAASPAAIQSGELIGSFDATGYSSTGWINDNITPIVPLTFLFQAAETWVSNTNIGTTFLLTQSPTATTITSAANNVQTLTINPQTFACRSDAFTWSNGKTGTTQTMALDVSGNLTVTGDIRINGNDIQNSGGTAAITLSSANATTTIKGDTITLENNAGTDYAVFNSTSATFAQPVGFPVKTAAQWNAITGAVGQQVCVSDSAGGSHPNGMMAFWDTTNARWSYIHDNSAV